MNTQGSIFYNHAYGRRFPVPLMALEAYAIASEQAQSDEELFDALLTTISAHCKIASPADADIEYFTNRLVQIKEEIVKNTSEESTKGRSFGTAYLDYVSALPLDAALLKMVNYDIDAAEKLYCSIDRDDAISLVRDYIQGKSEENMVSMEAAMYGMGGKYESDKGGKGCKGIDISTEEGAAALKQLGF